MLDLPTLGQELRRRRRALRIPSAEFARRIGVSQTYVWLIEGAKARPSGEPSRPSEDLLQRWTAALGMDEDESRRIRELAGYFDVDVARRPREARPMPTYSAPADSPDSDAESLRRYEAEPPDAAPHLVALSQWARAAHSPADEAALAERLYRLVQLAERTGRSGEAIALLDSFLQWLEFRLGDGR